MLNEIKKIFLYIYKITYISYRLKNCPILSNSSSMAQTELLQELTNDCRYDKMTRPPGEINSTNPINVYTKAYIYTIKSNMAKTLVACIIIIFYIHYIYI